MMTITVKATKNWSGEQHASTQLFSVPKGLWTGKAEIVRIDAAHGTRAWARVLDGRSPAFWSDPAVFGDLQSMKAITDLLVVQFFAEHDEQGTARGVFDTASIRLPKKLRFDLPPRYVLPLGKPGKPGPVEIESLAPRYSVLEGAEVLPEHELQQILGRALAVKPAL
jgi:hypothetical protein